jgi:hypothetical protein
MKLSYELKVLKYYWREFFWNLVIMFYVVRIVSRRLAMYFYTPTNNVLWDMGFELIPEYEHARVLSEFVVIVVHALLLIVCLVAFRSRKFYFVHVLRRYLVLVTIGQLMRATLFLPTSLPGPADHCQTSSDKFIEVKKVSDIFWDGGALDSVFYNCGDLIFSGHIFHTTIGVLLVHHFFYQITGKRWMLWMIILIPIHTLIIISSRQHYTVDLITGIYFGVFLWFISIDKFRDYIPRNDEIIFLG